VLSGRAAVKPNHSGEYMSTPSGGRCGEAPEDEDEDDETRITGGGI
jgi:hypothetical protein